MPKIDKTPVQEPQGTSTDTEVIPTKPADPAPATKEMVSISKEEYDLLQGYRKIVIDAMTNIRRVHSGQPGEQAEEGLSDDQVAKKRREAIKARRSMGKA